jgi:TolA-binding protein
MNCETCESLLLDLAYEELEARTAAQVRAHLASCERCAASAARLEVGRRMARAPPSVEPPAAVRATVIARARAMANERAAERRTAETNAGRGAAPGALERALGWVRGLLMGPQVAMAMVLLVVVGIGLFWVPKLRQSRRLAGPIVNPPAGEELGPAPLSPAEPLELALDAPQRRAAGRGEPAGDLAPTARPRPEEAGGGGRGPASGGEVLAAPLPSPPEDTARVADRGPLGPQGGLRQGTDGVFGGDDEAAAARRAPARDDRASEAVAAVADGVEAQRPWERSQAELRTGGGASGAGAAVASAPAASAGGRTVAEPFAVADVELAPSEALGERTGSARARSAPPAVGGLSAVAVGAATGSAPGSALSGGASPGSASSGVGAAGSAVALGRGEAEEAQPPARGGSLPPQPAAPPVGAHLAQAPARESAPATAQAYFDRGVAREQARDHRGAADDFEAVTRRADAGALLPAALHRQARNQAAAGATRQAIATYESLLARHPTYPGASQAMLEVAELYRRSGDLAAARRWLGRAEGSPATAAQARQRLQVLDQMDHAARRAAPARAE